MHFKFLINLQKISKKSFYFSVYAFLFLNFFFAYHLAHPVRWRIIGLNLDPPMNY